MKPRVRKPKPALRPERLTDKQKHDLTQELACSLALRMAYQTLPADLPFVGERSSEALAKIAYTVGQKYMGVQAADMWIAALRVAITNAGNIPAEAKTSLSGLVGQIEHEFFGPYLTATIITGIAAGLKGCGADIVRTGGVR
jgi:hypothetical protein